MSRILYIFPHPDDESFGPAPAIARQRREGHEVYLLTLTRGEATSQRHKLGYSREQMGTVRFDEMQAVARTLDLTELTVLNLPDGRLADMDPLPLQETIAEHIRRVQPEVVVTYAVHGISGHPDHLATHALVKHAYCTLRAQAAPFLKRLAFFTLSEEADSDRPAHLKGSPDDAIDCIVRYNTKDRDLAQQALACYVTYQEVVAAHKPLNQVADGVRFTFFQESHDPPLSALSDALRPRTTTT